MYKLYTDKAELFEAAIKISGASTADTDCRLIIETETVNLLFTGKINTDGMCQILIRALAKFLPEGTTGTMRLEVIAENTYFVPWTSNFLVETEKKVVAEVVSAKPATVMVEAIPTIKTTTPSALMTESSTKRSNASPTSETHVTNIGKMIMENKINGEMEKINSSLTNYFIKHRIDKKKATQLTMDAMKSIINLAD